MSLDERENSAVERSDEGLLSSSEPELITSTDDDVDKETQILSSNNDGENSDEIATDDESAEQKEMTVTNLKVTFEHLSQLTPDAKDKPNWWIRQNSKGEYIIYNSSGRPAGTKAYRKLSDPEKFLKHIDSQQIRVVDDGDKIRKFRSNNDSNSDDISNQSDDKNLVAVSNGSLDLHELCTTDSSSEEEERSTNGTEKETEGEEAIPGKPEETVSEVDNAQEAGETFETDKVSNRSEIISIISSKRSSNQSGTSMNLETLREKDKRQLSNVVQELIQTEKNYVSSLERGIKIYVHTLDTYAKNYPALLGKKYHIFGNIERLCAFHKEELLPSLIACNDDIVYIANLFYTFITKDYFYGYVLFGLNKPRAEKLTSEYKEFFDGITNKTDEDKLGVNSFLLQPIQILPRYKLLFGEIIKALANDIDGIKNVKDVLSVCCIAEKQIQRLLDNVNEALSMNDIEEIHEFDLLEQGKFKKMSEFTMFDSDVGRRFRGKAFLFEQTLLCTETIEKTGKLQYRTHIILDDVMFIDTDNKEGFKVITANNKETDFLANILVIQDWIKLLTPMDEKGVIIRSDIKVRNTGTVSRANSIFSSMSLHDKSTFSRNKLSSNTVRVTKREKLLSDIPPRVESIISNASTKSNRSSSSSQDSYDLGGTIWYVSLEDYSSSAPSPAVKTS